LAAENASLKNEIAALQAAASLAPPAATSAGRGTAIAAVIAVVAAASAAALIATLHTSLAQADAERERLRQDLSSCITCSDGALVVYDGFTPASSELRFFMVEAGVTWIGDSHFQDCYILESLEGMREGVTVIGDYAFSSCGSLTSLEGLPDDSLTTIGDYAFSYSGLTSLDCLPYTVTSIGNGAFRACENLTSIGLGFSLDCNVHPTAFRDCPALLAAAQSNGFDTVIAWGKHYYLFADDHWLAVNCRFPILCAVQQVRRDGLEEGSQLLARIALLCDDLVREVVEFVGGHGY